MPRAVKGSTGPAGIASYQLGASDEVTLAAATFVYSQGTSVNVPAIFLDCRAPTGQIIYLQLIDETDQNCRYSLAFGAEPAAAPISGKGNFGWPQDGGATNGYVTERLAPITLTPGCTLNVYAADALFTDPPPDPITAVDTGTLITDLLLWVEDTELAGAAHVTVGPFALVPGSNV